MGSGAIRMSRASNTQARDIHAANARAQASNTQEARTGNEARPRQPPPSRTIPRRKQARKTGARSETISPEKQRPRGTAQQAAPSYDKQGGAKGGTRQDRHETPRDRDWRSKQIDNRGGERRCKAERGTRRADRTRRMRQGRKARTP